MVTDKAEPRHKPGKTYAIHKLWWGERDARRGGEGGGHKHLHILYIYSDTVVMDGR